MKYTFLDLVQLVLSALDSDKVNTWSATSESEQVGLTIRDTFNYMVSDREIPELKALRTLVPYSELIRPTHFFYPEDCDNIEWIKYNKVTTVNGLPLNMVEVQYCLPQVFLDHSYQLNSNNTYVQTITEPDTNIKYLIRNDKNPDYWTSFDDKTIVMDSYLNTVDDTLQESKSLIYGRFLPRFRLEDTYIPPIDDNQFQILINKVKTTCFYELKKEFHQLAADDAKKARVRNFDKRSKYPTHTWNDYGRK
jgi:hypothetical protein